MFNLETISLFSKLTKENKTKVAKDLELARAELKRYECFNSLLNNKEEIFNQCRDTILQDILKSTRANPKVTREYLIGYQDALDVFLKNLDRYKQAVEKLS